METLSFNQHGQWNLLEKNSKNGLPSDADYLTYRTLDHQGELPKDSGQKGSLHGNPPARIPKKQSKHKSEGQVPTPVRSEYADTHPGQQPTD